MKHNTRENIVLLYIDTKKNQILCKMCHQYSILLDSHCMYNGECVRLGVDHFDNTTCIPIATLSSCHARFYGCLRDCETCVFINKQPRKN
jgi:hypothetical protein